jgi:glycosyltransferase involved in cell wall biosynthesis
MKIAFVGDGIYEYATRASEAVGGTERDQWLLSRALATHGWTTVIGVSRSLKPGERKTIDGVQYVGLNPSRNLFAWKQFLFSERPDWLFWEGASHLLGPVVELASWASVRSIFHTAFDSDVHPRRALFRHSRWWPLYAWGLQRTEKIFVQHRGQLSKLPLRLQRKAYVFPKVCNPLNGLSETFDVKPHNLRQKYVAWVAMLRQPKRPDVLVEIARAMPNTDFVVCGGTTTHRCPPGYGEWVTRLLRDLPNVDYRGQVSSFEAAQVIADAAVFLSTSDQEGFPNTFMQAWASGTPVVSLKVDPDEIIQRLLLGAVSGTREKAVADISALLGSPQERELINVRARRYIAESHSETAVISAFETAIHGAASDPEIADNLHSS